MRESDYERASALRAQGWSYRRIAATVGVSTTSVRRWLNPDEAEASRASARAWKDRNREANRARDRSHAASEEVRGTCTACGGLMGIGHREGGVCAGCRAVAHEIRWQRIEAWWAEGLSINAICSRLGCTKGSFGGEMALMRESGRDMPYRYRDTKLQRAGAA